MEEAPQMRHSKAPVPEAVVSDATDWLRHQCRKQRHSTQTGHFNGQDIFAENRRLEMMLGPA